MTYLARRDLGQPHAIPDHRDDILGELKLTVSCRQYNDIVITTSLLLRVTGHIEKRALMNNFFM
ncbi:MAG: hypothetical protein R2788_14245 [Saprospiraceae bacterium]